jgi:hypothetical protein
VTAVRVDVSCGKCGERRRVDIGEPAGGDIDEHRRMVTERLTHQPSFQCFGGHFELRPALPDFWVFHWETAGE